jgi:hypothetical protein
MSVLCYSSYAFFSFRALFSLFIVLLDKLELVEYGLCLFFVYPHDSLVIFLGLIMQPRTMLYYPRCSYILSISNTIDLLVISRF